MSVIWEGLLDFLFPRKCEICGKKGSLLCEWCKSKLEKPPVTLDRKRLKWGLKGVTALYSYKDPKVRHLIERIKFGFCDALIPEMMLKKTNFEDFDLIVPIPLHFFRENWRGFNQAERIAREIERTQELKNSRQSKVKRLLKRVRNTKQQARLKSREERKRNIKDAFKIVHGTFQIVPALPGIPKYGTHLKDKKVLLVDDVFTTGESMGEACKTLMKAGAKFVWGFVLAR